MPKQKSRQQPQHNASLPAHETDPCAELSALNRQLQQQLAEQSRLLEQAQQRIAELEERNYFTDSLLNAFPDLVMRLRRDGTYLDVKSAKDLSAIAPASELLGKKVSEVLPPEMAERRMRNIEQVLQTGQPQIFEQQLFRNNQLHDEELRIVPSGEDEVLIIVRDITERKQAERQLRQNQALLQAIIDNTAASIYVLDAQGRFLLINNAFAHLFNLDKKEVIGKTDYDIFSQDTAENYQNSDLEILKAGAPVQVEEYVSREDGQHTYITLKFPLFDDAGQPFALCGMATDITARKQAEENLAKRATELETVAEVGTAVSTVLETDNLLQLVVNLAKSRFNLYHAHIYLLNEAGNTLTPAAATGEVGQKMLAQNWQIPLSQEQSLVARAARTRQGVIANNVRSRLDFLANPLLPETQAEMAIPIIAGNNVLGVLDVQSDKLDYFTNEDIRVQSVLADQVAAAIQNTRLFQEMQLMLNETEALNRIARTLGQLTDVRTLAETALIEYLYILDLPQGGVLLFDEDKLHGTLIALVQQGQLVEPGLSIPIMGNPSYKQLLTTKESVIINDALHDPLLEPVRGLAHKLSIKSLLLAPIMVRGEVIGALGADSTETKHEFTPREVTLVRAVADQLGIAIENQRLFAETQATLVETEQLYKAGRRIVAAANIQEMVTAIAEVKLVPIINRVLIFLPERNVQGQIEAMVVAANWHSGQGTPPTPVGRRYPITIPGIDLMLTQEALFFDDAQDDKRLTGPVQEIMRQQNISAIAYLPLRVGERHVGAILLEAEEVYEFTTREIQPYLSLASQVAVAIENRRLLEEAQIRARREQMLREVTTRVRNAVDAETIMRTAVQEVGRTLGRPAFIYLGNGEQPAGHAEANQLVREGN
ncbi:MAG: GAF domain-containing protein [Anaerolineae bacterium]